MITLEPNKTIIAFDLDNTLINEEGKFYEGIKEILIKLKSYNIELYLVTGRTRYSLLSLPLFDEITELFESNIICNEGNLHIRKNKVEVINRVDNSLFQGFYNAHKDNYNWIIETDNNLLYTNKNDIKKLTSLSYISSSYFSYVEDLSFSIDNISTILSIYMFPKKEKQLDEMIADYYKVHYPGEMHALYKAFIKIYPQETDKSDGLNVILQKYGNASKDIIAIGDGRNDISLLRNSKLGVAVYNSHKELVEASDIHIKEELSIFLERLIDGRCKVSEIQSVELELT